MPTRKMRVELLDEDGNRYSVALEGQITRDKALRLLDLIELLGGVESSEKASRSQGALTPPEASKQSRIQNLIQNHFPLVWFSSHDVQLAYEQELKEPINLSTVSTYLARMANKASLTRTGASNRLQYKLVSIPQVAVKQRLYR